MCNIAQNCSPYASCIQVGDIYQCECFEGFIGDGYNCIQNNLEPYPSNSLDPNYDLYPPYPDYGQIPFDPNSLPEVI